MLKKDIKGKFKRFKDQISKPFIKFYSLKYIQFKLSRLNSKNNTNH